jgi:Tol biopolymer transport system component
MMLAWSRATYGKIPPTPMTICTMDTETGEIIQCTFDKWMNWAPYPAPDGRHYVFVRPLLDNASNWEILLGDLEGGESMELTFDDGFDGCPRSRLMAPRCCLPVPRERGLRAALTPM